MRLIFKTLVGLSSVLMLTIVGGFAVSANVGISTNVSVMPNIDKKLQIEGESYINYDVTGKEGQTMKMKMSVKNTQNKEVEVNVNVGNGLSGLGDISYEPAKENSISGFIDDRYIMDDIITGLPETIKLKANEIKKVEYEINVPEDLEGLYIGVIRFENADTLGGEGMFDMKVAYSMGVWLRGEEGPKAGAVVESVMFDSSSNPLKVIAKFNNESSQIIKNKVINYKIFKKESEGDIEVYESSETIMKISPKNYLMFPLGLEGEYVLGSYYIDINGDLFDFEIKDEDGEDEVKPEKNSTVVKDGKDSAPAWLWFLLSGLILSLQLAILIRRRKSVENGDSIGPDYEEVTEELDGEAEEVIDDSDSGDDETK